MQRSRFGLFAGLTAFIFSGVLLSPLAAQSAGEVAGMVADPHHAVVPNVEIRLINMQTSATLATRSNQDGLFRFPDVPPGSYRLTATIAGFATFQLAGISVDVARTSRADVALEVSSSQQEIRVVASEQMLDMDNGEKGQVIGTQMISNLPLPTENPLSLTTLTPGVITGNGGNTSDRQGSDGTAITSFYVINGGVRSPNGGFNEFIVDGISITNRRDGTILALPATGGIEQFQVQSGGLSPQIRQYRGRSDQLRQQERHQRVSRGAFRELSRDRHQCPSRASCHRRKAQQ